MNAIELRQRLRQTKHLFGTHVSLGEFAASEIFARAGFDFIWVDTEHAGMDYATLRAHLNAARSQGAAVLIRASMNDPEHVKRVLEMGAEGIVFPMINTPAEADRAMKATLYPPQGTRGCGPLGATGYGMIPFDDYIREVPDTLFRCIQIETVEAVKNLPEIIKNSLIDLYILGPCDLSASVGEPNRVRGARTVALMDETVKILHQAGKFAGVSTGGTGLANVSSDEFSFWRDLGIDVISAGGDFHYLAEGARGTIDALRRLY
jgi:2-dehydro-3-deoxyglucarate aldolase/4-hydroxy-2-oxoheptanedioate aldolase